MIIRTILFISIIVLFATTKVSAAVVHVFECHSKSGAAPDLVIQRSAAWLKAAREMPGGENIRVSLEVPLAAESGVKGFNYVVISPDLPSWAAFYAGYVNSGAAAADAGFEEVATCGDSSLYNTIEIAPEMANLGNE